MNARQITATQTLEDFRTQFNLLSVTMTLAILLTLDSNITATSVIGVLLMNYMLLLQEVWHLLFQMVQIHNLFQTVKL